MKKLRGICAFAVVVCWCLAQIPFIAVGILAKYVWTGLEAGWQLHDETMAFFIKEVP